MVDALPVVEPDPGSRFDPFPLTDQQQAYLVGRTGEFELGNVSTHAYYEYEGDLDLAQFDRAWQRVIERHDMLRAVIAPEHEHQRILENVPPFHAEVVGLRGLGAEERDRRLAEVRERLSHEVRPAEEYPLFGVVVSRLDDRRARVHISFDGLTLDYLSWQLLVADLTRFYDDPEADVPALELTFRDYVRAQESLRDTDSYRRAEEYWLNRVADLPSAPQLPASTDPADRARPKWTSRAGTLAQEQWSALKSLASKSGLTPTSLTLAVFAEVLALWSESPRFTLNVPRMNRLPLHPEANEILGEFASFSLLAVDHDGDAAFTDRAKAIQRQMWSDLAHQHVTGVRVLRELIRAGGGFQKALMPVVLTSTLGFTAGETPLLGARLERVFAISQTPQVHLDVQIEENRGALVYNWDSVDAVFPDGLVEAAFTAFGALLAKLADDPDQWQSRDLALVPAEHPTVGGIVGAERPVKPGLVQDLFVEQVRRRPDEIALIDGELALTYAEVSRRARQIGHWVRSHGGHGESPVAVVMIKGWEQVVAAYGALFGGSPYLPIDATLPANRIVRLLEQAGVRRVLTQADHAAGLAEVIGSGCAVLCVDDPAATDALPDGPLAPVQGPDDLAYVLFTSGSTGVPKGAMIEHAGMVNCLRDTIATFDIGPADRCLAVTALHHDMSTFDLFGVLGAGGVVVVPDADRARDPEHWAELIATHGVTVWNSVPAMMEMLLEHVTAAETDLSGLRLVLLGGDWIPLHVPRTVRSIVDGVRVVSVGGPTETTLWNIWYPIETVSDDWRSVPYGTPIANTRYRVVDPWLRDRPVGVAGELCCSGPGVARGYFGDAERTALAFVTHPVTGERLYRTGDLGRCRPDGVIEFVGRADAQVKIRGQRIELGEVEAALAAVAGVRSAAVTAVPHADRPGFRGLVGHVTLDGPGDGEEIRRALRAELPEHMVPATIEIHDRFPLTANGKVDRKVLARLGFDSDDGASRPAGFVAPETALEEVIADVWREALDVDRVGIEDDFFALGGDSVLATRIVVRLREALDTPDLPLLSLLSTVTVRKLADTLVADQEVPGRLEQVAEIALQIARMSEEDVEAELMKG